MFNCSHTKGEHSIFSPHDVCDFFSWLQKEWCLLLNVNILWKCLRKKENYMKSHNHDHSFIHYFTCVNTCPSHQIYHKWNCGYPFSLYFPHANTVSSMCVLNLCFLWTRWKMEKFCQLRTWSCIIYTFVLTILPSISQNIVAVSVNHLEQT